MSSRSSSPLSSAQDLSDPEVSFVKPVKKTKTKATKTKAIVAATTTTKGKPKVQTKMTAAGGKLKLKAPKSRKQQQAPPSESDSDGANDTRGGEDGEEEEEGEDEEAREEAEASPPPHKRRKVIDARDPLPQDNPRYAFIVAFQAKFNQVFRGVPNLGPQDIEAGVAETPISDQIEALLCKLLGLALNRQKQVEKGHYGRALEEAVANYIDEAPPEWGGRNPLEGGRTFNQMTVDERLVMLQTLVLWVLRHSRAVGDILKEIYKPGRKTDDSNISLAMHCWGLDREKNKYYLIEGKDDTYFRVYQEHISPGYRNASWMSVAGTIDELQDLAARLEQEGSKNARELRGKILAAIPRFEEGEQKRKRREYRTARRAAFLNPGVSMYEGRTRGLKAKYTFDSDEDGGYASGRAAAMRSTRASGRASPAENYVTGSGRVTRRTNQYGFGEGAGAPYAGSDSGGSARRAAGRVSLKRDRGEYEEGAGEGQGGEGEDEESESSPGEGRSEGGDDYKDEPADEMEDDEEEEGDVTEATDSGDIGEGVDGKTLMATLKFTTGPGKAALATLDGAEETATATTGQAEEGAMEVDVEEAPAHLVVNFVGTNLTSSSAASSVSQ